MGLPGKRALSFLRGEKPDATVQNAARTGMVVKMAKKIDVQRPPPTLRASHTGTMNRRVNRAMLEKCSLEGPSAGRGAFLIAGYCEEISMHPDGSL